MRINDDTEIVHAYVCKTLCGFDIDKGSEFHSMNEASFAWLSSVKLCNKNGCKQFTKQDLSDKLAVMR